MEVPETFKPKKLRKIRERIPCIEDLIIDEPSLGGVKNILKSIWFPVITERGINTHFIEKSVMVSYNSFGFGFLDSSVLLFQYEDSGTLRGNLKEIFEEGMMYYKKAYKKRFTDIFLFKDNISIYLECNREANEKLRKHYRQLGFKQLDFKLTEV